MKSVAQVKKTIRNRLSPLHHTIQTFDSRYPCKTSVLKTPADISPRHHTANLRTKADGEIECMQYADFQYLFYCKNTPSFTGKEKDSGKRIWRYYFRIVASKI